jgi:hypothetical protein
MVGRLKNRVERCVGNLIAVIDIWLPMSSSCLDILNSLALSPIPPSTSLSLSLSLSLRSSQFQSKIAYLWLSQVVVCQSPTLICPNPDRALRTRVATGLPFRGALLPGQRQSDYVAGLPRAQRTSSVSGFCFTRLLTSITTSLKFLLRLRRQYRRLPIQHTSNCDVSALQGLTGKEKGLFP